MKRVFLLAAVAASLSAAAPAQAAPSPGAPGLGDRLFPNLGNGGYDVQHYDLDLRYATSAPTQGIDGTVTILAKATQDLSRFDLDFAGQSVGSISVNGLPATFTRTPDDLVITPKLPLRNGRPFIVRVSHFTAAPTEANSDDFSTTAFFFHPAGSATAPAAQLGAPVPAVQRPPARQGELRHPLRRPRRADRGRQRRQARAVDRPRPQPLRLPPAPADGDRAAAARGRAVRRDQRRLPLRRVPARRHVEEHHGRDPAAARRHAGADRLHAGGASASTRSTSTARSWSRPTSASRWRRRRSS